MCRACKRTAGLEHYHWAGHGGPRAPYSCLAQPCRFSLHASEDSGNRSVLFLSEPEESVSLEAMGRSRV